MLNRALLLCLTVQLAAAAAYAAGECGATKLTTPALYYVHTGDEDKPIETLIIATSQPGEQEIHCAASRTRLIGSHWDVLIVREGEFKESINMLNLHVPFHKPDRHADFQYVLVSESGRVRKGPFNSKEAIGLFVDLAKYYERRQPNLHEKLSVIIRRLGGPEQPVH